MGNTIRTVAIVTVGNELLVGDTVNTNAAWLGQQLTKLGSRVERISVVPDDVEAIATEVNRYHTQFDAVIVTGGLGPTHDDVTMEGVSVALDRPLEEHPDAIEWLMTEGGYARDDLVVGTGELPRGAIALHNIVGVAPGAVVDSVYVLPGVPQEMKTMFETIQDDFLGDTYFVSELVTPQPESSLVEYLVAVQEQYDVGIGSYPGERVRIKVTGQNRVDVERAVAWLRERIQTDEE